MKTIVLFDIDGTLIRSGSAGKAALESSFLDLFGISYVQREVSYSGRTDLAIARELLENHGIPGTESNIQRLHESYLERLPESLIATKGIVLPGIEKTLSTLSQDHQVILGLLTGNIVEGAKRKLGHFGLWNYFHFGAFADGLYDRDDIARRALKETENLLKKEVDPQSIWVVGDTPLDIRCAKAIGARSVALATGWHSQEELAGHHPDLLYPDLSENDHFLESITNSRKENNRSD